MRRPKQQMLPLKLDRRHENPGRPKGKHPSMPHDTRADFLATHPCHVTMRVIPGLPSLRDGDVMREIEGAFRRGCGRESIRLIQDAVSQYDANALKIKVGGLMFMTTDMYAVGPPGRTEKMIPLVRKTFGDKMALYADSNSFY